MTTTTQVYMLIGGLNALVTWTGSFSIEKFVVKDNL